MGQIISFPAHRTTRAFMGTLPPDATPREEAIFRVRELRAERDSFDPETRQHHVAAIQLAWWEQELSGLVGPTLPLVTIGRG